MSREAIVLGGGGRVFGATSAMKPCRVVESRTLGEGLIFLAYQGIWGA
jgi:hypothetical protein